METIKLWKNTPGMCEEVPVLEYYKAENKATDTTIIICPGGGYGGRAKHEGEGYAEYFNSIGMDAFVLEYRVSPHRFPIELADARRAVRWVRHHAAEYGINPNKIGIMGSSAGGHLAAMLSTYPDPIDFEDEDEIDKEKFFPDFQVLCYPVITASDLAIVHTGSVINLLGAEQIHIAKDVDPCLRACPATPPAFIWHTSNDGAVNVCNSLRYGEALRKNNVLFEMHIFPEGAHGLGLAPDFPHIAQWAALLKNWLKENSLL